MIQPNQYKYIDLNHPISFEQAYVILALEEVSNLEYLHLVLPRENTPEAQLKSKKFIEIVCKVCQTLDYLTCRMQADGAIKTDFKQSKKDYLRKVVEASDEFLKLDAPSEEEKNNYLKIIHDAEKTFRHEGLKPNYSLGHTVLRFLTNFITHVTGLALIVNSIHKYQTGNWLFFSKNDLEEKSKKTAQDLVADIKNNHKGPASR